MDSSSGHLMLVSCLVAVTLSHLTDGTGLDHHLEQGRISLSQGRYTDALVHYQAALDEDRSNYLTLFKRATVYMALGKQRQALNDLDEVVKIKPEFIPARSQRGSLLFRQGRLDEALPDLQWTLHRDSMQTEIEHLYQLIEPMMENKETVKMLVHDGQHEHALEVMGNMLTEMPYDLELRQLRVRSFIRLHDYYNAISDLRIVTKMLPDDTDGLLQLSLLHYQLGEGEESLVSIRDCLKLDQDHKECHLHYKKVKKLVTQLKSIQDLINQKDWIGCAAKADAAFKTEPTVRTMIHLIKSKKCSCLSKSDEATKAIQACDEALALNEKDINVLCDLADSYLNNEEFDNALKTFSRANQIDPNNQRVEEGMRKSRKLEAQSKKRDYYKILGVKRSATKKDIIKAYRKLAQQWHPDNFQIESEKKAAEKKFMDIASAKEVLSDPEKRQKFDQGEDPLDPESSQHSHPFGNRGFHGFNGFHGGSHFTFNWE